GLDDRAAGGVDRMSDVGVELGPAVGVAGGAVLVELAAALVTEAGAQVVLAAAAGAAVGQLAAGHGHERPLGALDDLQVADDEGVVVRARAEGLRPLVVVFHQFDADLGDDHSCSPFFCGTGGRGNGWQKATGGDSGLGPRVREALPGTSPVASPSRATPSQEQSHSSPSAPLLLQEGTGDA